MCDRLAHFDLSWKTLCRELALNVRPRTEINESYNVRPKGLVPIVRSRSLGLVGDFARWGLIPTWLNRRSHRHCGHFTTVRAEEAMGRDFYRPGYERQRCLVPVSGYFILNPEGGSRCRYFVRPIFTSQPLFFPGLWSEIRFSEQTVLTCTILTEVASTPISIVHDRQPIMLGPDAVNDWLAGAPLDLLRRQPTANLSRHRVGPGVDWIGRDGPDLVQPLDRRRFFPLASWERAMTQPSLLDNTTTGRPRSSGWKTRSQET